MTEDTDAAREGAREDPAQCLLPGEFVDSAHPAVTAWAEAAVAGAADARARAVALYYAVRDGWRYDPYTMSFAPEDYRASVIVTRKRAFCVPKAVLLAAGARAAGIPARLGFADVKNHLASEKLRQAMGTDVFAFHGYVELWLDERWVKATPAFNRSLCEHFGVLPLEFDGTADALFHPFSADGRRHMEYVHDRGRYFDLPYDAMLAAFEEVYSFIRSDADATPHPLAGGVDDTFEGRR